MKVLVTGSSGQLGSEIVNQLSDYEVISIDMIPAPTTQHVIDIKDREQIFAITKDVDAIIHTAALHGRHVDLDYPRIDFIRTNVEGTLNLLEAAVYHQINKFIFTSTTSIYGKAMVDNHQAVWVDEELTPQPRDIYDITKLTGENMCLDFSEKYNLQVIVFRISRFMQEPENEVANYRLYRGIDIRDGAYGHILGLNSNLPGYHLFNLSNDTLFEKDDLVALKKAPKEVILKYYPDSKAIYESNQWRFPDSIDRVYVIKKAKKQLGFQPKYNFPEFIKPAYNG